MGTAHGLAQFCKAPRSLPLEQQFIDIGPLIEGCHLRVAFPHVGDFIK
jgi:hypothetical protein